MTNERYDGYFREAASALFDTLDPALRERARLIGKMSDTYIGTKRDLYLDVCFDGLVANASAELFGKSGKARALFVVGESGSGKTTSVEKHIAKRQAFQPRMSPDGIVRPLVWFEAPKPLTLKQLATLGLEALGFKVYNTKMTAKDLFDLWKDQLREKRVLFLAIDELQHILRGETTEELQNVADVLKTLLQIPGWPLHMILSGVPALARFLEQPGESERQLKERSSVVEFRRMTYPEDVPVMAKVVANIIQVEAGLRPDAVLGDEFIHRLIHARHGAFGSMIQTTRQACDNAHRLGKNAVGRAEFVAAYALSSGCRPPQNIFAAGKNWKDINPANSLAEMISESGGLRTKKGPTK